MVAHIYIMFSNERDAQLHILTKKDMSFTSTLRKKHTIEYLSTSGNCMELEPFKT